MLRITLRVRPSRVAVPGFQRMRTLQRQAHCQLIKHAHTVEKEFYARLLLPANPRCSVSVISSAWRWGPFLRPSHNSLRARIFGVGIPPSSDALMLNKRNERRRELSLRVSHQWSRPLTFLPRYQCLCWSRTLCITLDLVVRSRSLGNR